MTAARHTEARTRRRVLFLCTGNSARSQIAEAVLRRKAGNVFEVYSAGITPRPVHPMTKVALSEIGIDASSLSSKGLSDIPALERVLFVIIVCAHAEKSCPDTFAKAAVRLCWPFDDPARTRGSDEKVLAAFRQTREEISKRIDSWIESEVPPEWFEQPRVSIK